METHKGYYALIQYCPDASRLEAVNVGVLLFCPGLNFLKARVSREHNRASRLFGPRDWGFLDDQATVIIERLALEKERFRSLEDLNAFIDRRTGEIRLTTPRFVKVEDAESALDRLYGELVTEASPRPRTVRARTIFEQRLREAGLQQLIERNIQVEVPALHRSFDAPYGYRNGRYNLIDPITIPATIDAAFKEASAKAMEGAALKDVNSPRLGPLQLIVVGQFTAEAEHTRDMVQATLAQNGVAFHALTQVDALLTDIRNHARVA